MSTDRKNRIVIGFTLAIYLAGCGLLLLTGAATIGHLLDNAIALYLLGWAIYGIVSRLPLPELGARLLLTTSALMISWAIAEGAVLIGLIDYRTFLGAYEQDNPLSVGGRRFDKELLWVHEPYYRYEEPYQGNLGAALCTPPDPARKIALHYDKNGFRNNRDFSEADLLVIGDSYIEGYFTSEANLITTVLGELQGMPVANLGHSGYGPQQELAVLRRYGLPLKPKTVIWAFFEGNDFSDAEAYDKKVPIAGDEFWQDFWFRSLTRNVAALTFRSAHRSLATNVALMFPSTKPCVPNETIKEFRAVFTDADKMTATVLFAPFEVKTVSEPSFSRAAALIAEAAKLCREQNIRFLVAYVPEKFRVYHDLTNVSLLTDAIRQWRITDLPGRLHRLLRELEPSLEFVDLTPAMKAASQNGIATYLADDTHWTDEGHRVAAEAIHRALLRKPKS